MIERTPQTSPIHHLSPEEPQWTPIRATSPSYDSVFLTPGRLRAASSSKVISGEVFDINTPGVACLIPHRFADHVDVNVPLNSTKQLSDVTSVSTSKLSGECLRINQNPIAAESIFVRKEMATQEEILEQLGDLEHDIAYAYRNFPSNALDELSLGQDYEAALVSLDATVRSYSKAVNSLTIRFGASIDPDSIQAWKEKLTKMESDLSMYRREVRRRLADLKRTAIPAHQSSITGSLQCPTASLTSGTMSPPDALNTPVSPMTAEQMKIARESKIATAKAKSNLALIRQDLEDLNAEYSEHRDWMEADDADVEKAMGSLRSWRDKLSKAKKDTIEVEGKITGEELTTLSADLDRLKITLSATETELTSAIENIKEADVEKGLYSNRKAKAVPVQLPIFSGAPGDDFSEFQDKFEKAVVANRIPKSDQLEKLRESLRGKAKTQVSLKIESIDEAWDLLKTAFGDPMTLLKFRKQALSKLGVYPDALTRTNPQKIVDWCLDIERHIMDLIKLGDKDTRMEMVAFNDDTINSLIDMFPVRLQFKMDRLDCDGREKLEAIQNLVEEEREVLQRMAIRSSQSLRRPQKVDDAGRSPLKSSTIQPKGFSMYNQPRKMPHCRICKELEKRGDNSELYDAHQGNYPTHCPRWAAMTTDERSEIAKAAKYCLLCMDPKVTFNPGNSTKHKCIGNSSKNRFSCSANRCCYHSWVCLRHKSENKSLMEKFSQEFRKRNMVFTYLANLKPNMEDCQILYPSNLTSSDTSSVQIDDAALPARTNKYSGNNRKPPDLTINETMKKLKDLTPIGEELVTKVKDPPLFMFSSTPGRYSEVQIFYDTGNSHVLFKEGTPENLYGVKTRTGPFPLGAVGDTTVWGSDEWACQPMTVRGHREVLIGLCVSKITSNFPRINLKEATAEIKASVPNNREVQELCVPDFVGGECHVLLGIAYNSHFPQLVHSMESGLSIYKVKLKPSSPKCTAAIAGPHHSFNMLAGKVGNVALLLQKFKEGIDFWKDHGPPAPKSLSMSDEEQALATWINKADMANYAVLDIEDVASYTTASVIVPANSDDFSTPPSKSSSVSTPEAPKKPVDNYRTRVLTDTRGDFLEETDNTLLCGECSRIYSDDVQSSIPSGEPLCTTSQCETFSTDAFHQVYDPDQATLRKFISSQESPLNIEYRCPRCRSCVPCRNAVETEKVSLREEAEDAEIKSSVKLDFKNKRFICRLPLRGKIEEFLTTNRHSAQKVLDKQCQLYSRDANVKDLIVKAMTKLFTKGHFILLSDLPQYLQDQIHAEPIKYYIPWRATFKPGSLSTPVRPVFDCSSKTPMRPDGTAGRCLNDAMCKGRVMSLNLVKMLLRFLIGTHALSGDLKQFYNCFKLAPDDWHLQLFLWKDDMDPGADTVVAVISTLIYGNKASAPQTEEGMRQLSEHLRSSNPKLAEFLLECRFVDDLNTSEASKEACDALQTDADRELNSLGVESKGWGKTGEKPSEDIAVEGCMGVAGMSWSPELDTLEVKLGNLHFGSVSRGRLAPGTEIFEGKLGTLEEMNAFVPQKLTKRLITSKFMGVFDLLGKLIPLTSRMKRDLRLLTKTTPSWDEAVSNEHRTTWVKNFLDLEKAKGMKYSRPRMPVDAVDTNMRLLVLVDAASELLVIWSGVGFRRRCGEWSIAYLIGRSLLSSGGTIPRDEMEVLVAGSNMTWLLRQILSGWVDQFILAGDAMIPLFWTISEKKRLGLWHRTRSVQIRRGTPLDNLYHVKTAMNIADGPTRPDKLDLSSIGPGSVWETGLPWMTMELSEIVSSGILTPVKDLVLKKEDEKEFEEGFVLEKSPDVLTQGHYSSYLSSSTAEKRVKLVTERASFSNYLLLPTKFSYDKTVRILSLVAKFCDAFRRKWQSGYCERTHSGPKFQVFYTPFTGETVLDTTIFDISSFGASAAEGGPSLVAQFSAIASYHAGPAQNVKVRLNDQDIQDALKYLYLTATKEVEHFVKAETVNKIAVKKDGILYHKSRILDGQRFLKAGGFEGMDILRSQGINVLTPVIDRWSPLAYAIGAFIHTDIAKHKGYESCFRVSHSFVHILKGYSLFEEIGSDCVTCQKSNRRFVEAAMGPIHSSKFTLAPPFWCCQCDLWGPMTTYVPGREKHTRNSTALTSKVWAMVFVCCITKLTNIQIIETKDCDGICDGLTRFVCESGVPKHFMIDQETSLMKVLKDAHIDLVDFEGAVRRKVSVDFSVCPVSGHNAHGLVESKIKLAQIGLEKSGAGNLRLHATGAQTLAKMIETDLNCTPYGVTSGRSEANTPLLKLLSPNMMRLGRISSRNPQGPFKLPSGPKSLLNRVQDCYKLWFREYEDTLLMKYLLELQPKWFKSDRDTKIGDCVYFRKKDGRLDGPWQLGLVEDVVKSRDGLIRRVTIRYHNSSENCSRTTDRSIRSVVRLFNVDEGSWRHDMDQIQKILGQAGFQVAVEEAFERNIYPQSDASIFPTTPSKSLLGESVSKDTSFLPVNSFRNIKEVHSTITTSSKLACGCCCLPHHRFNLHGGKAGQLVPGILSAEKDCVILEEEPPYDQNSYLDVVSEQGACYVQNDVFLSHILSLQTDFDL